MSERLDNGIIVISTDLIRYSKDSLSYASEEPAAQYWMPEYRSSPLQPHSYKSSIKINISLHYSL